MGVWGLKAVVFGAGMMGSAMAQDMADSEDAPEVVVGDFDKKRVGEAVRRFGSEKISGRRLDVKDVQATKKAMKGADAAVYALPEGLNVYVSRAAIDSKVHLVDLAHSFRQFEFDARARKAGIASVPNCGVAPGITNILAARGASLMDEVDDIRIACGGLPQKPLSPLNYKITWSTGPPAHPWPGEHVLRESRHREGRESRRGGYNVRPREDRVPRGGRARDFQHARAHGLSTLLITMKGRAGNMVEKTARYPGHAWKIQAMRDLGFFDTKPVRVGGVKVVPRDVAISVLDKALMKGDERDLTVLSVDVAERKDGKPSMRAFVIVDRFDENRGSTSIARTTGYTAAIVARMVACGEIEDRGVIPPETAVLKVFDRFMAELDEREIKIQEVSGIGV